MQRIIVGYDGSPAAQRALDRAIELAKRFDAPLTVLTVADDHVVREDGVTTPAVDEPLAARIAGEGAEQARLLGVREVESRASMGAPAAVLAEAGQGADTWLVVGHRGLGGLRELFLGGVAKRVVDHATCSVLVVR